MSTQKPSMPGVHHVTAICGDPQKNIDFYSGLLGLRLVKKTVNFDDPSSYHLYYGDGVGSPGSIMTFFAWSNLPPMAQGQGRAGNGQIARVAFAIPEQALDYWVDRLADRAIDFDGPYERFGEQILSVKDPDGLILELVCRPGIEPSEPWQDSPIPEEYCIGKIHGVTACLMGFQRTAAMLTGQLGFKKVAEEGKHQRFSVGEGFDETMLDILVEPDAPRGRMGLGAVHHIAWRVADGEGQKRWRSMLADAGLDVTPVLDRQYFESIYFREPGGVLFEIATDVPGFTVDEDKSELGTHLKLPPQYESRRKSLESKLPEVHIVHGDRQSAGEKLQSPRFSGALRDDSDRPEQRPSR